VDRVELVREYRFESAHLLPRVPEGHKCRRLHGHSFKIEVAIAGPIDRETGWLLDFADIDQVVRPVVEELDHRYLNEIEGLENPTSEILARWLWHRVAPGLPGLTAVIVHETCNARCIYRGAETVRSDTTK
jgi:6-pyruvoyltetrahydropterin/6-carboxytetrahydropterin synthase